MADATVGSIIGFGEVYDDNIFTVTLTDDVPISDETTTSCLIIAIAAKIDFDSPYASSDGNSPHITDNRNLALTPPYAPPYYYLGNIRGTSLVRVQNYMAQRDPAYWAYQGQCRGIWPYYIRQALFVDDVITIDMSDSLADFRWLGANVHLAQNVGDFTRQTYFSGGAYTDGGTDNDYAALPGLMAVSEVTPFVPQELAGGGFTWDEATNGVSPDVGLDSAYDLQPASEPDFKLMYGFLQVPPPGIWQPGVGATTPAYTMVDAGPGWPVTGEGLLGWYAQGCCIAQIGITEGMEYPSPPPAPQTASLKRVVA